METAGQARGRRLRAESARYQQWRRRAADDPVLESSRLSAQRHRNRSRHGGMRGMIIRYRTLPALIVTASLGFAAAYAAPLCYKLPEEAAAFKPGAGIDGAQGHRPDCHSADYIKT